MSRSITAPALSDNALYARENATLQRLIDEESRLCAADAEIERRLQTEGLQSRIEAEAIALLSDEPTDASFKSATRQELGRIRHQKEVVRCAIQKQRRRIETARHEASRDIVAAIRPQYEAILSKTRDAIAKLKACLAEEKAFRDGVCDADVCFGELRPMGLDSRGEDALDCWLKEYAEFYSAA